ncbi:hypothetical protein JOL62DRAFT_134204 [Phyllosticta paracitricarpa]|uniref:protein-tyrosine-phosphatase n=1 Tax=Phyllosticta paracitricarpa TaxID=2016321 RepID=A0ABR1NIF0_9PEZI
MPVQTTARPHDAAAAMPSFMSVYGQDPKNNNKVIAADAPTRTAAAAPGQLLKRPATSSAVLCGSNASFAAFHHHRGSTSTSASGSTDSSPTTTISTMDGSSLTEPSPGPSPASPAAKVSPSSFSPDFRSRSAIDKNKPGSADGQFFELQRPTTPAKKPRNLKNLAVNTSGSLGMGRSATTANLPVVQNAPPSSSSAPSSPSFVKPPTPPRRRPSNLALTLQTGGKNNALPTLEIPPTPSVKRPNTLRHFQSSPSLPLCSPCVAPTGGMQLPPPSRSKPLPHGFAEVPMEAEEEEQEPNFDVPQSREEKPAAYPNGPICIYESGVFLYFEPTAEQASNYDVVLNVASEVVNPFVKIADETAGNANLVSKNGLPPPGESKLPHFTDRDFAEADSVPKTASDAQPSSPTTPKATPISGITQGEPHQRPEYIHIPWEHNTDIVPDLHRLVRLIDDRVQKGKRVLVHCQCGVSRSASLIVAYGLYKNPGISVQEAYDAVKKRSKWIGPNMNLIMQLQEFRNGLLRSSGHGQAFKHGIARRVSPNPAASRGKNTFGDEGSGSRTPATAPLPEEYDSPANPQRASTGNMVMIPPGPTSAPSSGWSPGFRRTWDASQAPLGSPIEHPFVDPMGHVIPVVTIQKETPETVREDKSRDGSKGRSNSETTVRQVSHRPSLQPSKDQNNQANVTELASEKQGEQARSSSISAPSLNRPTTSTSSLHERRQNKPKPLNEPFSPRTASFNLVPTSESDHGMVSPRNGNFALHDRAKGERPNDSVISMSDCCKGGNKRNTTAEPLASPRSEEFHMAPFLPSQESDDDFGLLSPTRFDFPKNPFEGIAAFAPSVGLSEGTSLRVHPIIPAATESQPTAFSQFENFGFIGPESASRPRTPYQLVKNKFSPSEEPSPMAIANGQKGPVASNEQVGSEHLSAKRPKLLRAKFSNPDLKTQFHLRALQGQLESQLPNHADQDANGDDALSSPRAHEFTQNPFHVDLEAGIMSPPSVRASLYLPDRTVLRKPVKVQSDSALKPRPIKMDPRSPAHAGVSPITRNIWDVL